MAAYITTCFSDWQSETFGRGIMAMVNGRRTDMAIRRPLGPDDQEGVRWYRKADPDFVQYTYSRCHRSLRRALQVGDTLFFRTLWRDRPYIIGYMVIQEKTGPADNPICHADPSNSHLIDFQLPVTAALVKRLNPRATINPNISFNQWVNVRLGRNYLCLQDDRIHGDRGRYLMDRVLTHVSALNGKAAS